MKCTGSHDVLRRLDSNGFYRTSKGFLQGFKGNLTDVCGDSMSMFQDFYSDNHGFYKNSVTFLNKFR